MALFTRFTDRKERNRRSRVNRIRRSTELLEAKAAKLRAKNKINTSTFKAKQKTMVQKIEETENIQDLRDTLNDLMPEKHWINDLLGNPQVMSLLNPSQAPTVELPTKELPTSPKALKISDRERLFMDFLQDNPVKAKIVEGELKKYAKTKGLDIKGLI